MLNMFYGSTSTVMSVNVYKCAPAVSVLSCLCVTVCTCVSVLSVFVSVGIWISFDVFARMQARHT